jgi:imidazolonepropionase-like amidohydrolase
MADTTFRNIAVVDVERGALLENRDVAIENDSIVSIEAAIQGQPVAPGDFDGKNRFLIPGLFDCHIHLAFNGFLNIQSDYRNNLKQFLLNGITQVVDFFTVGGRFPGSSPETIRDDINSGRILGPRFLTAYGCLNAPGGFCSCAVGSDVAGEVVTLDDVRRELDRIDAVKPDFIKIVYDDVFGTLPNLTPELLRSLIGEVHARGYRAGVHIATLSDAQHAVDCGADIIGHAVIESLPASLMDKMAANNVIMIPTLASYESRSLPRSRLPFPAHAPAQSLLEYGRHERTFYEKADQISLYRDGFLKASANMLPMHEAGVHLAAGSDSGTWYTFPGEGLHRELEIYVESGISHASALRMATIDAARAFRLNDRYGTVSAGKTANLAVLGSNPLMDINATRNIEAVMLNGRLLDIDRLRTDISRSSETPPMRIEEEICSPHHLRLEQLKLRNRLQV